MNLNRSDVERIVETMLADLSIEVKDGGWTDPNFRTVVLKYKEKEISNTWFSVKDKPEYNDY